MARPSSRRPNSIGEQPAGMAGDPRVADTMRRRRLPGRHASADGTAESPRATGDVWTRPPDDHSSDFFDDSLQGRTRTSGGESARIHADQSAPDHDVAEGRRQGRITRWAPPDEARDGADRRARIRRRGGPTTGTGSGEHGRGGTKTWRKGPTDELASRLRISDATVARLSATLLWVLVILAAYGGITAWMGAGDSSGADVVVPEPGEVPDGRWAAAGFAERYVTAYLATGSDGSVLSPYLGYTPDLPPTADSATVTGPVRAVDVQRAEDRPDYWSVTVAVGNPVSVAGDSTGASGDTVESEAGEGATGGESFWQAAVDTSGGQPVAVGLPAPVAGPPDPDRRPVATSLSQAPSNDPAVESVEGFLAAYLCGAPDLDRYLHPEAVLVAGDRAVCNSVEVVRWGSVKAASGGGGGETEATNSEERQTVVAEVEFDSGNQARRATYGLTLAQRDGRWEVAALLPAPPLKER